MYIQWILSLLWDTSIHGTLARARWYVLSRSSIVLWHRVIAGCVLHHTFTDESDKTATSWSLATNIPLEIFSLLNNFPIQYPKKLGENRLDFSYLPGLKRMGGGGGRGGWVRAPAFSWTSAESSLEGASLLYSVLRALSHPSSPTRDDALRMFAWEATIWRNCMPIFGLKVF